MFPYYLFFFFVPLVLLLLWKAIDAQRKQLPEEFDLEPLLSQLCGARYGMYHCTYPFARHTIYETFIVIKYLGKSHILDRDNIQFEIIASGISYFSPSNPYNRINIYLFDKESALKILRK